MLNCSDLLEVNWRIVFAQKMTLCIFLELSYTFYDCLLELFIRLCSV